MKIILPNTLVDNLTIGKYPLFFLAGPNKGGGNWREQCCMEIAKRFPEFFAVVPCSYHSGNVLSSHRVPDLKGFEGFFSSQTSWEHFYLNLSAERSREHAGCTIFWLPIESETHPRDDGNPYARDTYGELGRWGKNAAITGSHLVVGAERDFPGLGVIKKNFELDFEDNFPIYATLEEAVEQAAQWVKT